MYRVDPFMTGESPGSGDARLSNDCGLVVGCDSLVSLSFFVLLMGGGKPQL